MHKQVKLFAEHINLLETAENADMMGAIRKGFGAFIFESVKQSLLEAFDEYEAAALTPEQAINKMFTQFKAIQTLAGPNPQMKSYIEHYLTLLLPIIFKVPELKSREDADAARKSLSARGNAVEKFFTDPANAKVVAGLGKIGITPDIMDKYLEKASEKFMPFYQ